jgi:hypothetical protein
MALYKIVKSWCYDAGLEEGKIISLASLHPALVSHVVLISESDEVEVSNLSLEVATPEPEPEETPKRRA